MTYGKFNFAQQQQLIKGVNGSRIEKRKQGGVQLSYLAQHDVRAHLIRMFGFGHFDLLTEETSLAFEHTRKSSSGKDMWEVGYRVTMRLVVRDEEQRFVCSYSETAVGSSMSADRGEAHDNAVKNGSSDAMKRCAINLGDQFGLSLYANGQTAPFVRGTIVVDGPTTGEKAPQSDEQPSGVHEEQERQNKPSQAALDAQMHLASLTALAGGERITEVAKFKSANPEMLSDTVDVDGQTMTLARFADLVAAGKFSEQEGNN